MQHPSGRGEGCSSSSENSLASPPVSSRGLSRGAGGKCHLSVGRNRAVWAATTIPNTPLCFGTQACTFLVGCTGLIMTKTCLWPSLFLFIPPENPRLRSLQRNEAQLFHSRVPLLLPPKLFFASAAFHGPSLSICRTKEKVLELLASVQEHRRARSQANNRRTDSKAAAPRSCRAGPAGECFDFLARLP